MPLLPGMEPPPHPMRLGEDEKDYYRLGGAGVVGQHRTHRATRVRGGPSYGPSPEGDSK